ncbi:MAG: FlgD immunoglobulin-like domain containing protein [Candidatus Krumholzibacteriia bacterium]
MRHRPTRPLIGLLLLVASLALADTGAELRQALGQLPAAALPSGILLDRVVGLSPLTVADGGPDAPALGAADLRQMLRELRGAADQPSRWPSPADLRRFARDADPATVPLVLVETRYDRLRRDDLVSGRLQANLTVAPGTDPGALTTAGRVFAAAALRERTYHGSRLSIVLPAVALATSEPLNGLQLDADDGRGWRPLATDTPLSVNYPTTGRRTLRLMATLPDGTRLEARAHLDVLALDTPAPTQTWPLTADEPFGGAYGTGQAYLYLAPGHTSLTNPVVVIEGFDLDNSLGWPELYDLLNRENLLEDLRAEGFDAVVLDFTESTDPIQRNAYLVSTLLGRVEAELPAGQPYTLVGASMGGLVGRYALTRDESLARPHGVRTFISFDGAQNGANIPVGLQFWLDFFADESADAAYLLSRLNLPAARQMLLYHYQSAGGPDPARPALMAELAALGDWPQQPRLVSVANGSGSSANQGFNPGAQLVRWEYGSLLVDIVGNVWAVPDHTSGVIFDGLIDLIWPLPDRSLTVTASGLRPLDGAPGGWRASIAELDAQDAPYGDIIGLHPNHAFIPTVSALALDVDDVFYDVAGGDPAPLTPFDAIYYPAVNEEHVLISPAGKDWLLAEIRGAVTAAPQPLGLPAAPLTLSVGPNPFNPLTQVRFSAATAGQATLSVHDVRGRRLATLVDGRVEAGEHTVAWDGRDAARRKLAAGVYLLHLTKDGQAVTSRVTLLP